jgi:hypothetical protein
VLPGGKSKGGFNSLQRTLSRNAGVMGHGDTSSGLGGNLSEQSGRSTTQLSEPFGSLGNMSPLHRSALSSH